MHALAIHQILVNRALLFVYLSVYNLVLSANSSSSQTIVYVQFHTPSMILLPCSLDQVLASIIGTCRLATSRYLPPLAEGTMLTTYLYSHGAHSLELRMENTLTFGGEETISLSPNVSTLTMHARVG